MASIKRIESHPQAPPRPDDAHKGTFGKVLIVAGSRGMSGAACLAGLGALRGGAGLVTVAAPQGILPIVAAAEPSYLTLPLPDDEDGRIVNGARHSLEISIAAQTALAVGPGMGRGVEGEAMAARLAHRSSQRSAGRGSYRVDLRVAHGGSSGSPGWLRIGLL